MNNKLINVFILSTLLSSSSNAIKIGLEFDENLTPTQRNAFMTAGHKLQSVLVNEDLPRVKDNDGYNIIIKASAAYIDGPGRILGQAGPVRLRPVSHIPSRSVMRFDSSDLIEMQRNGTLTSVITHEMGHALGFGTIWQYLNLTNNDPRNPLFVGANVKKAYKELRNSESSCNVALENFGGPGTSGFHWRKSVFGNELMTGYISPGASPLSILTIAAFKDRCIIDKI